MANQREPVKCHCGWRGKRVNVIFKDIDYDEYTHTWGYCPKCRACVYPVQQMRIWAAQDRAAPAPPGGQEGGER